MMSNKMEAILTLNTVGFQSSLAKAGAETKAFERSTTGFGAGMTKSSANAEKGIAGLGNKLKSLSGFGGTATNSLGKFGSQLGALGTIGVVAGAVVGLGAAFYSFAKAAAEEQKINAQINSAIKSTGGIANVTSDHINALAERIADYSGISHDATKQAASLGLAFTEVRNRGEGSKATFDRMIITAADMSARLGKDMPDAVKVLGKALQDPEKGMTMLRRAGVVLNETEKGAISTAMAHNDVLGAQSSLLDALETRYKGAAAAAGDTLAGKIAILKDEWDRFKESVGEEVLPTVTKGLSILGSTVAEAGVIIKNAKKDLDFKTPSEWIVDVKVDPKNLVAVQKGIAKGGVLSVVTKVDKKPVDDLAASFDKLAKAATSAMADTDEALKELETELATGGLKSVAQDTFDSMIDAIKNASPGVRKEGYKMLDDIVGDIARYSKPMQAAGSELMSGLETAIEQAKQNGVAVTNDFIISTIQSMMATGTPEMQQAGAELIAALQSYFKNNPAKPELSSAEMKKTVDAIGKQINIPVVFNPVTGQFETAKGTVEVPIGTPVTLNPITGRWEVAKTGAEQPVTTPVTLNPITGLSDTARRIAQGRIDTWVYFHPETSAADAARARLTTSIGALFTVHHTGGPVLHGGGSVPAFHSGGMGQEVIAKLLRGEYVMQNSAVDKYGMAFMDAVNRGLLPSGGSTSNTSTATNNVTIHVSGAGNPVSVAQEVRKVLDNVTANATHLQRVT